MVVHKCKSIIIGLVIMLMVSLFSVCVSLAEKQTVEFQYRDVYDYLDTDHLRDYSSCDFDYHILEDNTAILDFYYGKEAVMYVPEEIDGYIVSEINTGCFYTNHDFETIIVPGGINRICEGAFKCVVETIEIREGVKEIVGGAFCECTVKTINIPNSAVLSTGVNGELNPFISCLKLESILVNESHPELIVENNVLFNKKRSLLICYPSGLKAESYVVPDSVNEIGKYAFFDVKPLKSIMLPHGLKRIGFKAFAWCDLEKVVIPDSVEEIEAQAFLENRNIYQLTLSSHLCEIGSEAFSDAKITDVYLPESLWYIGESAFDKNVVFHVIPDSYSYYYAIENGYQFSMIP